MKVYVDELPKSCEKCKFYECETELVGEWGMKNYRHICKINGSLIQGICPLHSLADYTKQVRKEVCEEIKEKADIEFEKCRYENYITGEDTLMRRKLYRIDEEKLDQIQGE